MKTRVISGLVMLPLAAVLVIGGYVLWIACFIIGIMAVREFFNGFEAMDIHPNFYIAGAAAIGLYGINILGLEKYMSLWFFGVVLASCLYLFNINERKLEDALATITGIFYLIFFSYHIVLIDQSPYSSFIWLAILSAFLTDIFAYFSGYFFGKHKLCPVISPKKTIEGSIGGTLGAVIGCGVFGYLVNPELTVHCLVIGLLGGIISQFGDLTASIFKRKMGIKDYGTLIPGHGGILDRFDSVMFTAPLVYYYILIVLM